MAKNPYSTRITDAQVMIHGIRENQDVLQERLIDAEFADKLDNLVANSIGYNNEQEVLKAKLKEKTEQLRGELAALDKKTSEARKIIKLYMPQSSWREFGILDKR